MLLMLTLGLGPGAAVPAAAAVPVPRPVGEAMRYRLPYALNVVYFIPQDHTAAAGYRDRLTRILLGAQAFFRQEMERYGYPNSTMGLAMTPDRRVSLSVVHGRHPASHYPYEGGYQPIMDEVRASTTSIPSRSAVSTTW